MNPKPRRTSARRMGLAAILFLATLLTPLADTPAQTPADDAEAANTATDTPVQAAEDGDAVTVAYTRAVDGQQRIVADLARILNEEKVRLSDGAIQMGLEGLLKDEIRMRDRIRELGMQTLGKTERELTAEELALRNGMADEQDVFRDRYRRLEKVIEAKAAAEPNSVFALVLITAVDEDLARNLTRLGEEIRGNQLGRAIQTIEPVIATLETLVKAIKGEASADGPDTDAQGITFGAPSLWFKSAEQALTDFPWAGADKTDALGRILRSMKRVEQLIERQTKVVEQTNTRAPREQTAEDLAKEEWEIRFYALETGAELALLDPIFERLIRRAAGSIEEAIPPMEQGPLRHAIEPAERALAQLHEAHAQLQSIWKMFMALLKEYTQNAEPIIGGMMGIPHPPSEKEAMEKLQLIYKLIRAVGALTQAIEREEALLPRTAEEDPLTPVAEEQQALILVIDQDVLPHDVPATELRATQRSVRLIEGVTAAEVLEEAKDRMGRAIASMEAADRQEAVKWEGQAVELMTDALDVMMNVLQHLLGQFSPPGLAMEGIMQGMGLDPTGAVDLPAGHAFQLLDADREQFMQAFRGEFPDRYADAIKLYYQALAEMGRE